jgi:hypothetical protein
MHSTLTGIDCDLNYLKTSAEVLSFMTLDSSRSMINSVNQSWQTCSKDSIQV